MPIHMQLAQLVDSKRYTVVTNRQTVGCTLLIALPFQLMRSVKVLHTCTSQVNVQNCGKQEHNHERTYSRQTSRKRETISRAKEALSGMWCRLQRSQWRVNCTTAQCNWLGVVSQYMYCIIETIFHSALQQQQQQWVTELRFLILCPTLHKTGHFADDLPRCSTEKTKSNTNKAIYTKRL